MMRRIRSLLSRTLHALANPRFIALATAATLATFVAGCYIGKAEFKGEDMKMYPLFGMSAEAAE